MSIREKEQVNCPACGTQNPFDVWPSLNVSIDPGQKPRLLEGKFFCFRCLQCGQTVHVPYPFLYHDMHQRCMIWLSWDNFAGAPSPLPEQPPQMVAAGYRFRHVGSDSELIEKVLIFDAGLDDAPIEMIKLEIARRLPPELMHDDTNIYFSAGGEEAGTRTLEFAILAPDGTHGATVNRDPMYAELKTVWDSLSEASSQQWPRVDRRYVLERLESARAADDLD